MKLTPCDGTLSSRTVTTISFSSPSSTTASSGSNADTEMPVDGTPSCTSKNIVGYRDSAPKMMSYASSSVSTAALSNPIPVSPG